MAPGSEKYLGHTWALGCWRSRPEAASSVESSPYKSSLLESALYGDLSWGVITAFYLGSPAVNTPMRVLCTIGERRL